MPKAIQMKSMSVAHSDEELSARDEDPETATAYRSWTHHLCRAEGWLKIISLNKVDRGLEKSVAEATEISGGQAR
jgi:hypothetical protein